MRLFIALHLDQDTRARLEALQTSLRQADGCRQVRWVEPNGIHLTLKFLGEVPPDKLSVLEAAVAGAVAGRPAPQLGLGALGAFPTPNRPRVLWVGLVESGDALPPLQAAVESAVVPMGWEPEKRAFQPHLTLGRVKEGERGAPVRLEPTLQRALLETPLPAPVHRPLDRLALVRSHLSPAGASYEDLRIWRLPAG